MADDLQIFSFEPINAIYDILSLNSKSFGQSISTFQMGLSDIEGEAAFNYFPNVSIMSSKYSNLDYKKSLFRNSLKNQLNKEGKIINNENIIDAVVNSKLQSKQVMVQLTTLGSIIEQHRIKKIDLLKIDVEESELEVLDGLRDQDWKIVKQLVVEVHGLEKKQKIIKLLQKNHFKVFESVDQALKNTDIVNLYASEL